MVIVEGKANAVQPEALVKLSIGIGEEISKELANRLAFFNGHTTRITQPCQKRIQTFPFRLRLRELRGSDTHSQGILDNKY